jgi:hypothetical protein
MRVPADLDESICLYFNLSPLLRAKFDRCAFWMGIAPNQWPFSASSYFASFVSAMEALTIRDAVGPTRRFRDFLEQHAPGETLKDDRKEMYNLRSDIYHGSDLMQLDQNVAFGWDPPFWGQFQLNETLWRVARMAVRDWIRNPT